ncbi:MAG: hypothetical protein IKL78_01955 [Lachnospiraceae bacterium]|nr:hypothetical protein [Lachnospiraceae bacterium]
MKKVTAILFYIFITLGFLAGCQTEAPVQTGNTEENIVINNENTEQEAIVETVMNDRTDETNTYTNLCIPTYITRVDDCYFIVDCYHNQVIYHDNLTDPLEQWKVMVDGLSRPHTMASDGIVYLIDDTENHKIIVMQKRMNDYGEYYFEITQEFSDIGTRPHYIIYHEESNTFYAWSSMTGEMYLFQREVDATEVELAEVRKIDQLMGVYVRSFTIVDDAIYFVSGQQKILKAQLSDLEIVAEYPVIPEIAGMAQISLIGDYYYVTVSTDVSGSQDYKTMIRADSLESLATGEFDVLYDLFGCDGTPYNITHFDGHLYLAEHRISNCRIWQFDVNNNEIENITKIY